MEQLSTSIKYLPLKFTGSGYDGETPMWIWKRSRSEVFTIRSSEDLLQSRNSGRDLSLIHPTPMKYEETKTAFYFKRCAAVIPRFTYKWPLQEVRVVRTSQRQFYTDPKSTS